MSEKKWKKSVKKETCIQFVFGFSCAELYKSVLKNNTLLISAWSNAKILLKQTLGVCLKEFWS